MSGNNSLCPLERFVKGISEPLHFDLSKPWELLKPFRRSFGNIGEALTRSLINLQPRRNKGTSVMDRKCHTPIDERRVSTSVLLTLLMLVRADRKTDE